MKNRIDERKLTRQFLNTVLSENYDNQATCCNCNCDPCLCSNLNSGESHSSLEHDQEGIVSKDDLYNHFDLNQDGAVSKDDYTSHVEYHCAHPETLDHYNVLSTASAQTVPCRNSYEDSSNYCLTDPESMHSLITPIMSATGSTCQISAIQGLLDVIKSMKECGLI